MSNPDEFKILLATDIHLGYQHKHEVSVPPPSASCLGIGPFSVSRCAGFLPQESAERNSRLKRTAIQSLPEGWILSIPLSYCTLKHRWMIETVDGKQGRSHRRSNKAEPFHVWISLSSLSSVTWKGQPGHV